MCLVAVALIAYAIILGLDAPVLSGQQSGPFGASTLATLAGDCAAAVLATGLGLIAATRARRAALGLGGASTLARG